MATSRKRNYRILLNQNTACDFHVTANSYEEACRILERELRTHMFRRAMLGNVVDTHWSDPTKDGEAWLITCATGNRKDSPPPIKIWDGKKIADTGLAPLLSTAKPRKKRVTDKRNG